MGIWNSESVFFVPGHDGSEICARLKVRRDKSKSMMQPLFLAEREIPSSFGGEFS